MKPAPWRLDENAYPVTLEVQTRFGDLDPLRHLNNVALARVYEEGRVRLHDRLRAAFEADGRVVVARVAIDYLGEGRYPAPLTLGTGVLRVGEASYTIGQGLFQQGVCIGVAETVVVYTVSGASRPLPEAVRAALQPLLLTAPVDRG